VLILNTDIEMEPITIARFHILLRNNPTVKPPVVPKVSPVAATKVFAVLDVARTTPNLFGICPAFG